MNNEGVEDRVSEPVEHEDALAELTRALQRGRVRQGFAAGQLPTKTGLSRTVVSQALNGARIPSAATITALARVLKLDTKPLLLLRDRATRAAGGGKCPYPGMAAFSTERSSVFVGRASLVTDLVEHLDRRTRDGGIQMVVGASGAGKSSLLRAGLVPRLAAGALDHPWSSPTMVVLTPSGDPPAALARALADAGIEDITRVPADAGASEADDSAGGVIVVVDQFEEIFTECSDAKARRAFVASLTTLAAAGPGGALPRALVVVGVRDDFYPACQRHRELGDALADRPVRSAH